MRIVCHSVEDFKSNLEGENVFLSKIHEEWSKVEITEDSLFEVFYKLSAIIDFGEGGQALVQSGESCGLDRPLSDEFAGTARMAEMREDVHSWAAGNHWVVKPGLLDF